MVSFPRKARLGLGVIVKVLELERPIPRAFDVASTLTNDDGQESVQKSRNDWPQEHECGEYPGFPALYAMQELCHFDACQHNFPRRGA